MIARLFCRLALAVGVVLAVAVPAFADVPALHPSFKAHSFDELPRLDPKAILSPNSDRAEAECLALCELAASVDADPLGYGSTPRPFDVRPTPFGRQYFYANANPTYFTDPTGNYSWREAKEDARWAKDFTGAFASDIAKNGGKGAVQIVAKTAKNVQTIVEETPVTIADAGVLGFEAATGKSTGYQVRSSLARSTANRLAQGESAADITQEVGTNIALNLVNGQVVSQQLEAYADFQTGRATLDELEGRFTDAAASGVTNAGLAVGLKKGYDWTQARAASAIASAEAPKSGGASGGADFVDPISIGERPIIVGKVRPYNEAQKARIPGYDDHHLDPPLGRKDPNYSKGPTIPVRNDNSGGRVAGGENWHTGKGGFQQALNQHIKDLGFTRQQWNVLPNESRQLLLARYYASQGIPFPRR